MSETDNGNNIRLRHTFVAMLFALVAGQIALTTVDVFQLFQNEIPHDYKLYAAISHLILIVVVLTTSWVGWSMSVIGNDESLQLKTVFSRPYIILLIDMLLVIIYFAMVQMVEISSLWVVHEYGTFKKEVRVGVPSADEEILILSIIFFLYSVWDTIHDKKICTYTVSTNLFIKTFCNIFTRTWISGLFLVLVVATGIFLEYVDNPNNWIIVVLIDISLMAIVFAFRAAKIIQRSNPDESDEDVDGVNYKRKRLCRGWLLVCAVIYLTTIVWILLLN